jgi:Spy/CpxP family protein refolding chaperone
MTQIDDVGRLHTAIRKHKTGLMLDLRAMLTVEQRRELRQLMQKRRQRWKNRAGKQGKRGKRGKHRRERREHADTRD